MFYHYRDKKEHKLIFCLFQKRDLNLDFFSKLSELKIMVVSLRFLRSKVSINFEILSVALLTIINLCLFKKRFG
jgi:hypothetical protein